LCSDAWRLLLLVFKAKFDPGSSPHFSGFLLPAICHGWSLLSKNSARSDGAVFAQLGDLRRVIAKFLKHQCIVLTQLWPDPFAFTGSL